MTSSRQLHAAATRIGQVTELVGAVGTVVAAGIATPLRLRPAARHGWT